MISLKSQIGIFVIQKVANIRANSKQMTFLRIHSASEPPNFSEEEFFVGNDTVPINVSSFEESQ